jgi:hypothetical protein
LQIGLTALSENQQGGSEVEQQKIVRVGIEEQSGNRSQQHDTKKIKNQTRTNVRTRIFQRQEKSDGNQK